MADEPLGTLEIEEICLPFMLTITIAGSEQTLIGMACAKTTWTLKRGTVLGELRLTEGGDTRITEETLL